MMRLYGNKCPNCSKEDKVVYATHVEIVDGEFKLSCPFCNDTDEDEESIHCANVVSLQMYSFLVSIKEYLNLSDEWNISHRFLNILRTIDMLAGSSIIEYITEQVFEKEDKNVDIRS